MIVLQERDRARAQVEALLINTQPSSDFDDLITLVAYSFATKFALVSLVESSRTWYKAKYGLNVCGSPRKSACCAHAILGADVFVVMDARVDARFASNATVSRPLHLRFYAGALIIIDGAALGTLCLLDNEPRQKFDEGDREHLERFSRVAASCAVKRRIMSDCPI